MTHVQRSEEQQNLATNWCGVQKLLEETDQAKGREVRDVHNHMSVSNLLWLQDAKFIISDVDDRQQTFKEWSCENTDLFLQPTTSL